LAYSVRKGEHVMNILHIASLTGSAYKGVEVAVPQHIRAQEKHENVALINIQNKPIDGIKNQFEYTTPFSLKTLPAPFDSPDLVVFHEVYRVPYLSISAHLRQQKIPYIILPHGSLTDMAQRKSRVKKIVGNLLLFNRFINNAKGIQFLSKKEQDRSRNKKKGFVGANGVTLPDTFKTEFNKDKVQFVFIGRKDIYYKGLDLLLSAIALESSVLKEHNTQIHLYGSSNENNLLRLEELIKDLPIDDLVKNHDSIFGDSKAEALLSADIFVQTSRSEGMPLSILEALSYGVPCLVTEGTNLGALIREYDAGWVIQADVQDIAQGLKLVISQREQWTRKAANARRLVQENYLWDKVVFDALENYNHIVNQG